MNDIHARPYQFDIAGIRTWTPERAVARALDIVKGAGFETARVMSVVDAEHTDEDRDGLPELDPGVLPRWTVTLIAEEAWSVDPNEVLDRIEIQLESQEQPSALYPE